MANVIDKRPILHMTLFEGTFRKTTEIERKEIERQREEREKGRKGEREKECLRVGCQMIWYSN